MAILGGVAVGVIAALPGASPTKLPVTIPGLPNPVSGAPAAGLGTSAAMEVACRSSYTVLHEAADAYQTLKGNAAPSLAALAPYLGTLSPSSHFTFSIDPQKPGVIEVATPGHPASPGDANCAFAS